MREALRLAERGRGTTSPNPMVGAVVVLGGRVIGRGWHRRAGEPHAEAIALEEAGEKARGAALYVTLEPCCHRGRTGPCTDRILEAGIVRVNAATIDPYPEVCGLGIDRLREAGVRVEVGEGEKEALRLNEAFFLALREGRPWVDLKMAATLDGKIADGLGVSQWISGEESRKVVHHLRWGTDAVIAGIGTVLVDDPLLTARRRGSTREPLRVLLDGDLRTPLSARTLREADAARVRIAAMESAPRSRKSALEERGATVWTFPAAPDGEVPLRAVLERLHGEGARRVLVEGGGVVAGSFLRERLVDRIHLFYAPKLLGRGKDLFPGLGDLALGQAMPMRIEKVRRRGADLEVVLEPERESCSPVS